MGGQQRGKGAAGGKRRLSKAEVAFLRVRIVAACNEREVTPKEIANREGLPVKTVAYHFRALEKQRYLRVSHKEPARGVTRHHYVAEQKKVITDREFAEMTKEEKHAATAGGLRDLLDRCKEALAAGTLDARPDSHLSWALLSLDEQGWEELQIHLDWLLERSLQIHEGALARLRKSGEDPIPTTIAIAGFESPASESIVTDSSN